ncbi:hypothetical protein PoB_001290900 [Plakobranchus ocellatus]|uniref:SMB domain-containing protein n=1 Tax=Plakobranchus ocellatus TaxID=259542 RepID=A0AAV3YWG8_9GAST|nr:hypothetical protein PoB_001290900 [Plakobranchus ocellatus]
MFQVITLNAIVILANVLGITSTVAKQEKVLNLEGRPLNDLLEDVEINMRPTKALFTEPFTIPYREDDPECQKIAFDYVYRENICGAPDPDTYMATYKSRYTCENRCGDASSYGKNLLNCACDEKCVAFGDCCRDISITCPETYARGQTKYSFLKGREDNVCLKASYNIFYQYTAAYYSTTMQTTSIPATQIVPVIDNEVFGSVILKYYFRSFAVADSSKNIVYDGIEPFMKAAKSTSVPFFIPKMASLSCPYIPLNNLNSLKKILDSCKIIKVKEVVSGHRRNCKVNQVIDCHCSNGLTYIQDVHNICMGQKISKLTRNRIWNGEIKSLDRLSIDTQCRVTNLTGVGLHAHRTDETLQQMRVKVTKFLKTFNGFGKDVSWKDGDFQKDFRSGLWNMTNQMNIYFIIEFEKTIEKRLRCATLNRRLFDCKLEECTHGAILSHMGNTFGLFGNRSCVIPVLANVLVLDNSMDVPMCSCLRVMAALGALQIWTLRRRPGKKSGCSFSLSLHAQGEEVEAVSL